jgi:hypothetical protein
MIEVSVRPLSPILAYTTTDALLRLHNTGPRAYLAVVVEFQASGGLVLVHGDRTIEIDHLAPGAQREHAVTLEAAAAGTGRIDLTNLSYRDALGQIYDAGGTSLPIPIAPGSRVRIPKAPPARPILPPAGPTSVFVSHRSTDSIWFTRILVERLRRNLAPRPVFVDVHDLQAGEDWRARLRGELQDCGALLALIGPTWSSGSEVLRWEITSALRRRVPVLPVLFDGARAPRRSELPEELAALADMQACRVEPRTALYDLATIELALRRLLSPRRQQAPSGR